MLDLTLLKTSVIFFRFGIYPPQRTDLGKSLQNWIYPEGVGIDAGPTGAVGCSTAVEQAVRNKASPKTSFFICHPFFSLFIKNPRTEILGCLRINS
jgi:hypothetical protein